MKTPTPSQFYDHNPAHFRFARQLTNPYGLEVSRPYTLGDRLVYAACLVIALLMVLGYVS